MISLGCVAALFVKHVSGDYNGTIPVMVTLIPLALHLLLVRDIYVKWESRYGCGSASTVRLGGVSSASGRALRIVGIGRAYIQR